MEPGGTSGFFPLQPVLDAAKECVGQFLRKEVLPMVQFLLDVAGQILDSVLTVLVLRRFFRD